MFAYLLEPPLHKYIPRGILGFLMQELHPMAIPLIKYGMYRDFWSAVTGIKLSRREFLAAGERITVLERHMNTREGIRREHDTLPERLLKEGRACDSKKRTIPLDRLRAAYYRKRGYDQDGIPTPKTLERLDIEIKG